MGPVGPFKGRSLVVVSTATRCQFWYLSKSVWILYATTGAICNSGFGVGGVASGG